MEVAHPLVRGDECLPDLGRALVRQRAPARIVDEE